jgi:hypothetical protein
LGYEDVKEVVFEITVIDFPVHKNKKIARSDVTNFVCVGMAYSVLSFSLGRSLLKD